MVKFTHRLLLKLIVCSILHLILYGSANATEVMGTLKSLIGEFIYPKWIAQDLFLYSEGEDFSFSYEDTPDDLSEKISSEVSIEEDSFSGEAIEMEDGPEVLLVPPSDRPQLSLTIRMLGPSIWDPLYPQRVLEVKKQNHFDISSPKDSVFYSQFFQTQSFETFLHIRIFPSVTKQVRDFWNREILSKIKSLDHLTLSPGPNPIHLLSDISKLNLSTLISLRIQGSKLDEKVVPYLHLIVRQNRGLINLDLQDCDLFLAPFFEKLPSLPHLVSLNIMGNQLDQGVKQLSDFLSKSRNLASLSIGELHERSLDTGDLSYLIELLKNTKSLKHLTYDSLGKKGGLKGINQILEIGSLNSLFITKTRYWDRCTLDFVDHCDFAQIVGKSNSLYTLTFPYLKNSEEAVAFFGALGSVATKNSSLKSLDVSNCAIGDAGALELAKTLNKLPNLRSLGLRATNLGTSGAQALARAISEIFKEKEDVNPFLLTLNGNPQEVLLPFQSLMEQKKVIIMD